MENSVKTVDAKHIFIDIVSYTHNRSVEAQTDLISSLNQVVKESIDEKSLNDKEYLFIPTGDGMCISLLNVSVPYDIHLLIALSILEKVHSHNSNEKDVMRQFHIRVGINENIDNLIVDINNKLNISGSGINLASRIEGLCDKNQILIGNSVFEKLVQREKYMNSFVSFSASVKHGLPIEVHQYKNEQLNYLNNGVPLKFRPKQKKEIKIFLLQGQYMAHCIKLEKFITKNIDGAQGGYSLQVLLLHLAEDAVEKSHETKFTSKPTQKVKRSIQEHFEYLQSVDFWIIADLQTYRVKNLLSNIQDYFVEVDFSSTYLAINAKGRKKLLEDQPEICAEHEIK